MKYVTEIAFGLGLSFLLSYYVSCDNGPSPRVRKHVAKVQLNELVKFIEISKRNYGDFPTEIQTISDPWGIPYTYSLTYGAPRVCSLGTDRLAGTDDDICTP